MLTLRKKAVGFAIALVLLMTSTMYVEAQNPKTANIWYFGQEAGLDFTNGHPVALTDGAMSSFEGCATISDDLGNLQFYTNGGALPFAGGIWNRNHQLMPNGDLTNTGGCNSSFQSSLIVNHTRNKNIYYVLTTDCIENGAIGGLRYHVVDMTLDGGLGDIVAKDQFLTGSVDESLTAVQHANGYDHWIISHKLHTDSFYVYHLSAYGIVGLVKTKIGNVTPDYAGAIKASTNGEKLVYAGLNWTSVFDFDNATGTISNHVDLGQAGYSATFSPNCKLLYVADGSGGNIYQYDVLAADIPATKTLVGTTTSNGIGAMQLGPNGRIYIARFVSSNFLGVIEKPNFKGTDCNYVDDGFFLDGKVGKGGLPNYANNTIGECIYYPEENTTQFSGMQLHAININNNRFTLNWVENGPAMAYKVLVRTEAQDSWKTYLTEMNSVDIKDLAPGTKYQVKVLPIHTLHEGYELIDGHLTEDVIGQPLLKESKTNNEIFVNTLGEFEFSMFPNPTKGNTQIIVDLGAEPNNITISIIDLSGKVAKEWRYNGLEGTQNFIVDTYSLSNGIYNVAVQTNENYSVKKLILAR